MSLKETTQALKEKKVLVIGDLMLDKYIRGSTTRKSQEAPVFILDYQGENDVLGGAANVASNIKHLGGEVRLCGVIGKGDEQKRFLSELDKMGISKKGIIEDSSRPLTLKKRFLSVDSDHVEHQMLRVDIESRENIKEETQEKIIEYVKKVIEDIDVIALSDYAKGVFSKKLAQKIIELAKKYNKKIIVDPKPQNIEFFKGCNLVCPNKKEAKEISQEEELKLSAQKICRKTESEHVIITCGKEGLYLYNKDGTDYFDHAIPIEISNVTGAGDTVLAVLALGMATQQELTQIVSLANLAASIAVQKKGTIAVKFEEIIDKISKNNL